MKMIKSAAITAALFGFAFIGSLVVGVSDNTANAVVIEFEDGSLLVAVFEFDDGSLLI